MTDAYTRLDALCRTRHNMRAHELLTHDPGTFDEIRDEVVNEVLEERTKGSKGGKA